MNGNGATTMAAAEGARMATAAADAADKADQDTAAGPQLLA